MRRPILLSTIVLTTIVFCVELVSCKTSPPPSERLHATVLMRDGTQVSGIVTASSPSQITLAGDDNTTRTIPMKDVQSVNYDQQPVAQAEAPPAAAPSQSGPPARQPQPPVQSQQPVHQGHYHPQQSAVQTKTYALPVGTQVSVRTEETIDSSKAVEGQTFAAEVTNDVLDANGDVVIPRVSNAQIVIRSASRGGRFRGASDLVLDLQTVSVDGRQYRLDTADVQQRGKEGIGANKRTAEYTGGGAALGAIIGAIAGGGKGAAIGAASGAGAGALTQILTKGSAVRVPAETVLTFRLDKPLRVVAAR